MPSFALKTIIGAPISISTSTKDLLLTLLLTHLTQSVSKKKHKAKPAKKGKAEEPKAAYGKKVTFFNSFEEQEEDNFRWLASLTPEQHLQNATVLIKRVYAADLKRNPSIGSRLYFD